MSCAKPTTRSGTRVLSSVSTVIVSPIEKLLDLQRALLEDDLARAAAATTRTRRA